MWVQLLCLICELYALLKLSKREGISHGEIVQGTFVSWVVLMEELVVSVFFIQIPSDHPVITRVKNKAFTIAYTIAEDVGLGHVLDTSLLLSIICVDRCEAEVGSSEIWIELYGALKKGNGLQILAHVSQCISFRVELQCFE